MKVTDQPFGYVTFSTKREPFGNVGPFVFLEVAQLSYARLQAENGIFIN